VDASILYVGELSDLTLDNMIYDINKNTGTGALQIVKGVMRFASGIAPNLNFTVKTANATLGVRGTTFDLIATSGGTEMAVREGVIQVEFPSGSKQVVAGQVFRIPKIGEAGFESSMSVKMKKSVSKMIRMLEVSPVEASKITVKKKNAKQKEDPALKQSPAEKNATIGKNLDNILYMDLSYGRVIIEMMPNLAPNHIKRIKQLVREKFYDGHKFHNVMSGFVAETGDPMGTGIGGSGTKLRAEISRTRFTRGLVGMKRDRNNLDSADSQFFILLGDAMHLDGKYTAWGRVIHGMLLMDRMRTGSPPMNPDHIVRMRIASDRAR
jgi:cyclophilin family peptidyl-prolyl cis-trans isomerase